MKTPWREILAGLAIALGASGLGAAVDVRDDVRANKAEIHRVDDVQAARYEAIQRRLDDIAATLHDRKSTP